LIVSQHAAAVANSEAGGNDFYSQAVASLLQPLQAAQKFGRCQIQRIESCGQEHPIQAVFGSCLRQAFNPRQFLVVPEVSRNIKPSVGIMLGLVASNQAQNDGTAQHNNKNNESIFHNRSTV